MITERTSGILLHPTSLPGPHGIGDLGPSAYHFVDWLVSAGQGLWQVLPLCPIGPGNSPYASVSAFAGSPLMVALEPLIAAGWLRPPNPDELAGFDKRWVDFGRVIPWRMAKLREAARSFFTNATAEDHAAYASYVESKRAWLDDYALFMALDAAHQGGEGFVAWPDWPPELARREPAALDAAREHHHDELEFWRFVQFCFDRQWRELERYANERGVKLVGDMPIFVAAHSADCWSRPELYHLDDELRPAVVAGVPPDFFSETGQRWGNPLYNWDAMKADGYAWWIARTRRQLELADLVRFDHFRGFAGYWEIPASCPNAIDGRWMPGPGAALFDALEAALGRLPVIAEDLGIITDEVEALRDRFELPGMKVLQFAFSGDANHPFLPHNYSANCVVYPATHDNNTVRGWFDSAPARERAFAQIYLGANEHEPHWAMIRAAAASVAQLAIYQFQDVLGLDGSQRMNVPGQTGCWTWRFDWDMVGPEHARRLARLCAAHGRAAFERLELPG
ncbi:4-alpha-glucanotransferase [Enhygromyxa salina]|uniref:4-alpha-glucanotransferase n=1 Tax=Enhygromyxa salina TaxID=215803 RepID=A0A2S9YEG7_9BACT|nr:4-alpha-glucanotransferase [Enhygromyxa salina]PRQ03432.1 4-alpha-glucanotransferase [Enhygromyxa salina]